MNINEIAETTPEYEGTKWVFFGSECLFWTTDIRDLKKISDFKQTPLGNDSCCPFCGGPIQQIELDEFLHIAEHKNEDGHYGPKGLEMLELAHAVNATTCRLRWDRYDVKIN